MVICESGGTVYTADLKSAACNGLTGSSPVSRTSLVLAYQGLYIDNIILS